MGISSPGIGSNLDVNGIVSQLMQVESQPLQLLQKKEASYQAKLTAFGTLSGAVGAFQGALSGLTSASKFQGFSASTGDPGVLTASANNKAITGSYNVNVSQLAQAQVLMSSGVVNTAASIGTGASTTLTFQFGSISGGTFSSTGTKLGTGVASSGIAANSLSLNGTTITTSGATNSASALAAQINLVTGTTGVTATAQATDTGALGTFTTTSGAGTYTLNVGGVNIISNAAAGTTAANIDTAIANAAANLTAAGVSYSGTAAAGTLKFTAADGSNIAIQESGAGAAGGFASAIGIGSTKTFTSSVALSSANPITVGGSNPAVAGFTAGTLTVGTYSGATFTQDATQTSGTVTIDSSNNTLLGIRDAINKANIGVTASIVSDGSASPYHLVIKSNKTGTVSSMKISVAGDASVSNLLTYDPAGTQKMLQSNSAQNTLATVNGVSITSANNAISDAIQGVTLNINKLGSTSVSVSRDTSSVSSGINAFVKAYNDLNKTIKDLTAYDPATQKSGLLLGDPTVSSIQTEIRQKLSASIPQLTGSVKTLSDVGVSFQKDGTLSVDSSKLQNAITNNFSDMAALFSAIGSPSDSLINYVSSTSATKPGSYSVNVTQLATQGKVTGSAGAGLTITNGVNDQLNLTVDGVSATINLVAGTYSNIDALVSQVQSAINGASTFTKAGIGVKVNADNSNVLTITSNRYGSASNVSVSGNGASNLLGNAQVSTAGVDVAGSINGITAAGSGQFLTGASKSVVDGLKLEITGGSTGSRGIVNFSQGYAIKLNDLLSNYLGPSGLISGRTNGINSTIKQLKSQEDSFNTRLAATEQRYRAQFTALDTAIGSMKKTSDFLSQQLANLPKTS